VSGLSSQFPQKVLIVDNDSETIPTYVHCLGSSVVFVPQSGERVCEGCGIVLAEKLESEVDQGINFETKTGGHTGLPSSLALADRGLSTVIPYLVKDVNGVALSTDQRTRMKKMRRWDEISKGNRSYHRNLANAFSLLLRIKNKLSLSDPLTEKAAYYYRKTVDLKIIKGRSIKGFVVACLYIACREMNNPRSIEEISRAIDTDRIFAGKCYRFLIKRLKIKLPEIDARFNLSRIASNSGVSEKTLRRAADLMAVIKDNPISYGKEPNALAVAVLYAACLDEGEKTTRTRIASAANMSLVTLRNRLVDVRKVFPNIPNGPGYYQKSSSF
jgi:transcription initiation factor TFIIB